MPSRRKSKEELTQELLSEREHAGEWDQGDPNGGDATGGRGAEASDANPNSNSHRGPAEGDILALEDHHVDEINGLYRLLGTNGYLPAGPYEIQSDGENVIMTVPVLLPSSGGIPQGERNG